MFTKGSNCFWFWHFDACFLSARSCQTAFHNPFPYFTTFWRDAPTCFHWKTSSLKSNPLRHSTLLVVVDVFLQRFVLCTVFPHCILQRPPQRCVGVQRGFFFFFGGFCLYVLSKWRGLLDCYDDLIWKYFGQKIFLKIGFLERFLLRPLDSNRHSKSISCLI